MRFGLTALLLVLFSVEVGAQSACAPRDRILASLKKSHKEVVLIQGSWEHGILDIVANPDTQTYSIVVTGREGNACLAMAGTDLRLVGQPGLWIRLGGAPW